MSPEQAASTQPEPESFDAEFMKDVASAYTEEAGKDTIVADTPAPEVKVDAPAEPKSDHPTEKDRYADGTYKPTKPVEDKADVTTPAADVTTPPPALGKDKVIPAENVTTPAANVTTPAVAPPRGWSVKSKSEWEKLPEHFRADVLKREQEIEQGFAQYDGLKPVLKYAEMARQRGTTLEAALDNYVSIENLLSQDLLKGILHIAGNAGVRPEQLAHALQPYAGSQSPAPEGQQVQSFDPAMLQQWIKPLEQKVSQFEHLFQNQQMGAVNGALERFKSDPAHRYYANVEASMVQFLEGGAVKRTGDYTADLKSAYELACLYDPEIRELLFNERIAKTEAAKQKTERDAAEKAKLASRSIAGSSTSSSTEPADADESIEDTVRKAVRQHAA